MPQPQLISISRYSAVHTLRTRSQVVCANYDQTEEWNEGHINTAKHPNTQPTMTAERVDIQDKPVRLQYQLRTKATHQHHMSGNGSRPNRPSTPYTRGQKTTWGQKKPPHLIIPRVQTPCLARPRGTTTKARSTWSSPRLPPTRLTPVPLHPATVPPR